MSKVTLLMAVMITGLFAGCKPGATSQVEEVPPLPAYSGPKASVVLGSFECQANNCYLGVGRGIADAMVTAMVQAGRFQVVEAADNLGVLQNELDVTGDASAFQGADLAIIGTVTQFEPNAGGTSGSGSVLGMFGGGSVNKASATIDLRVVDIKTRNIVAVTKVTGEATSVGMSGGRYGWFSGGSLSTYENTPMETALQKMIYTAVVELSNKIPQVYYLY